MSDEQKTVEGVDPGAAADGRPEWLPDNFTRPEDLAKSYSESRKEMDRLRSQLDEERAQFAAALERIESMQQPAPQAQADPQQNQLLAAYQNAVEAGDAATMLSIQLALSQQATAQVLESKLGELKPQLEAGSQTDRDIAFRLAEGRVQQQYGERWNEIGTDVDKWLKEHPAFLPQVNSPDAWETVIGEAARYVVNEKAAEKLAELERDRAAKLSAQTSTGSASGRFSTLTDEKKQEWEAVKGADTTSYGQIARN